jgi:DNA-directed RNA polymerase sigma subunit (sigma70/sigma32)
MELRFGLNRYEACTLEQIDLSLGVTRERIRQIEQATLEKLSTLPEAQALRERHPSEQ